MKLPQYKTKSYLVEMYTKKGKSKEYIARINGVSPNTLDRYLNLHKIKKRTLSEAVELIHAGSRKNKIKLDKTLKNKKWLDHKYNSEKLSTTEIADVLGITHQTVLFYMKKFEIKRRTNSESRKGKGHPHTPESRKKIGLAHEGRPKSEKTKRLLSIAHTGKKIAPEVIEKRRKTQLKTNQDPAQRAKYANPGKSNPMYGVPSPHGKGEWYTMKNGNKVWMRSSYEIAFAKYLDQNGLHWEYEPVRFQLTDRTYAVDFYVYEWNKWIEVKGWFHERHQETTKQFIEHYSQLKYEVLLKQDLIKLGINIK